MTQFSSAVICTCIRPSTIQRNNLRLWGSPVCGQRRTFDERASEVRETVTIDVEILRALGLAFAHEQTSHPFGAPVSPCVPPSYRTSM